MSDREEKVAQFIAITDVSEDRAKFFLDSSSWQLDVALARYYENDGEEEPDIVESLPSPRIEEMPGEGPNESSPKGKPKSKTKNSRFATLNTLASSDEEEEGQAFYAGGSENSGQQVLGPPKKKDIVSDMFKSVQESGVEIVKNKASTSNSKAFRGTGYKLGETANDSVAVAGLPEPPAPSEVTLKLWKEGFSVNDGELRPYTDPANREFLDNIRRGEIPNELRQAGSEIHLAMEDHRMDVFKPSSKKPKAFSGQGYTLGNPAPPVVGACREEDKAVNEARAKEELQLDTSEPMTNLQIRLADGTRLIAKFNHRHTIGEIRKYIITARPQYATQEFNLITSYPSKVLEDSQTIVEAGILNAAIMQKIV